MRMRMRIRIRMRMKVGLWIKKTYFFLFYQYLKSSSVSKHKLSVSVNKNLGFLHFFYTKLYQNLYIANLLNPSTVHLTYIGLFKVNNSFFSWITTTFLPDFLCPMYVV